MTHRRTDAPTHRRTPPNRNASRLLRALGELQRALAPGGAVIIFETFGTATEAPQRQGSWLYAHFRASGLEETYVRTDYRFPSMAAALDTLTFFFGRGVASRASKVMVAEPDGHCIVPECTGVWWMRKRAPPGD